MKNFLKCSIILASLWGASHVNAEKEEDCGPVVALSHGAKIPIISIGGSVDVGEKMQSAKVVYKSEHGLALCSASYSSHGLKLYSLFEVGAGVAREENENTQQNDYTGVVSVAAAYGAAYGPARNLSAGLGVQADLQTRSIKNSNFSPFKPIFVVGANITNDTRINGKLKYNIGIDRSKPDERLAYEDGKLSVEVSVSKKF